MENEVITVSSPGSVTAPSGAAGVEGAGPSMNPPVGGGSAPKGAAGLFAGSHGATAMALLREAALLPVLVVLIIVGALVSPVFLTVSNMSGVGQQISSLGVVVVGESLILLVGGIDLSLEGTYGFAPMVAAWLIVPVAAYGQGAELSPYLGILICLAIGAGIGMVNGLLIVKGRLNGFIVTLGMTVLLAGMQLGVVKGQTIPDLPGRSPTWERHTVGQVPVSLIATVVIFVGVGLFLRYHRTGRAIYAVGGNPAAARAAGIKVNRIRPGSTSPAACSPRSGRADGGRTGVGCDRDAGLRRGHHLQVFAAAVIGGVSLKGGRGNMVGAATGVVLLGLVQNILDLANVSNYWIEAIDGLVILLALVIARVIGGKESAE